MANLTDAQERIAVDYWARFVAPPALTAPANVVLLSALGTGDAAGTEVGGTVKAYGATAAATDANGVTTSSNGALLRWEGLPNPTTVAGFRIQDSAATPVIVLDNIARTSGSVSVTDGIFEVPLGDLVTEGR
jgi:hypothetical protein